MTRAEERYRLQRPVIPRYEMVMEPELDAGILGERGRAVPSSRAVTEIVSTRSTWNRGGSPRRLGRQRIELSEFVWTRNEAHSAVARGGLETGRCPDFRGS